MNFSDLLKKENKNNNKYTLTENGALAYNTSLDSLVDFFASLSSLRYSSDSEIQEIFFNAYEANKVLAIKALFYARSIRKVGQGERKIFRVILKFLASHDKTTCKKILALIPVYGRYDDLYAFVDTPLEEDAFRILYNDYKYDLELLELNENKSISLVGKWLKSINSKNRETRKLGILTAKHFVKFKKELRGLPHELSSYEEKLYRTNLATLRRRISIVETALAQKNYDELEYESIPSKAFLKYTAAFKRNDFDNFNDFLDDLKEGKAHINADALTPVDIFRKADLSIDSLNSNKPCFRFIGYDEDGKVLEELWKNLPNYVDGENDVLVVADTSGSMTSNKRLPLLASLSLAIYFAERNKGPWHNKMITFSSDPYFVDLVGNDLNEKLQKIPSICSNTDVEKVFDLVLETALKNHLKNNELPKNILIISDMEFNYSVKNPEMTYFEGTKDEFNENGYDLPNIIFWNVNSNRTVFHALANEKGVSLCSGYSPSIFNTLMSSVQKTPLEMTLEILSNPYFDLIEKTLN